MSSGSSSERNPRTPEAEVKPGMVWKTDWSPEKGICFIERSLMRRRFGRLERGNGLIDGVMVGKRVVVVAGVFQRKCKHVNGINVGYRNN